MWYCSWTSIGQKSGTKTNSPAHIYIYIYIYAKERGADSRWPANRFASHMWICPFLAGTSYNGGKRNRVDATFVWQARTQRRATQMTHVPSLKQLCLLCQNQGSLRHRRVICLSQRKNVPPHVGRPPFKSARFLGWCFTHFQNFAPRTFTFKTKGLSSRRTKEKKREKKKNKSMLHVSCCTFVLLLEKAGEGYANCIPPPMASQDSGPPVQLQFQTPLPVSPEPY